MKGYLLVISLCSIVVLSSTARKLVWSDEFNRNGGVDTRKWDFDKGGHGWGNNEKQYYTHNRRENARCERFRGSSNGRLILEARKEFYGGSQYTSVRLKSKMSWTYGRLQIRAKLPTGRGLWPALWMLPQKQVYSNKYWPDNGEIDLMEQVGYEPNRIHSTVHTQANNHMLNNHPSHSVIVNDATSNFKIYTLEWNHDKLEMPFNKPFFIVMNIAVGGNWGGTKGIDDGVFPRRMEIDWVRFYQ